MQKTLSIDLFHLNTTHINANDGFNVSVGSKQTVMAIQKQSDMYRTNSIEPIGTYKQILHINRHCRSRGCKTWYTVIHWIEPPPIMDPKHGLEDRLDRTTTNYGSKAWFRG
eukprot:438708_1